MPTRKERDYDIFINTEENYDDILDTIDEDDFPKNSDIYEDLVDGGRKRKPLIDNE